MVNCENSYPDSHLRAMLKWWLGFGPLNKFLLITLRNSVNYSFSASQPELNLQQLLHDVQVCLNRAFSRVVSLEQGITVLSFDSSSILRIALQKIWTVNTVMYYGQEEIQAVTLDPISVGWPNAIDFNSEQEGYFTLYHFLPSWLDPFAL